MEPFSSVGSQLYDDVRRRTNNTIMFYSGEPVYVRHYQEAMVSIVPVESAYHGTVNATIVPYTDPKLVDTIPTLGYVNIADRRAQFVTRNTPRSQRSGLPVEQLIAGGSYMDQFSYLSSAFKDMLLNRYPTIQEAWEGTRTNVCCAFSKSYAIDNRMNIFHRGVVIGRLKPSERYYAGYEIGYVSSITRVSFYRKNFEDRFKKQLAEFKPS